MPDLAAQPGRVDHGEIDAIDENSARLRHVETLDKLGKRALARSRRTDDTDDLARGYGEIHVMQHFGSIDAITECHMLEGDLLRGSAEVRHVPGLKVGSGMVLRMSPSRATDKRAW